MSKPSCSNTKGILASRKIVPTDNLYGLSDSGVWSLPHGHHDRHISGLNKACLELAQQLGTVQVAPNEDQSAHALLLFPPRLPNALST